VSTAYALHATPPHPTPPPMGLCFCTLVRLPSPTRGMGLRYPRASDSSTVPAPPRYLLVSPAFNHHYPFFPPPPSYSKNESLTTNATLTQPQAFAGFDFLVTEAPQFHSQLFDVVFTAEGFKAVNWRHARVVTAPALFVMRAKGSGA
jgi:hypothetical protein